MFTEVVMLAYANSYWVAWVAALQNRKGRKNDT